MKVYFKNLDGIRFFAAFFVLLHHAFFFKKSYSPGFTFINHSLDDAGRIGVNLFFVLSGFLISYLLLLEKDKTGTISYKNFYIRRILRIWPIYLTFGFFLTFIAPLIFEKLGLRESIGLQTMLTNFLFLILFAVNFQLAFFSVNKGIFEISWSVCIEEQFYLIWPIIINVFRKWLPWVFLVMFSIRMLLRVLCVVLPHYFSVTTDELVYINYLLIFDKLDLFGGGMLCALLFYNKDRYKYFLKRILHPALQISMIVITILYSLAIIRPPKIIFFFTDHMICTVLFGYLLLAAVAENSVLHLEQRLLKTLGKVSYGIYLFHTAVCQFLLTLFVKVIKHPESHLIYDFLYPVLCTVVTCIIAYFSYEYFEKIFLKKKINYALVPTRV